MSRLMLKFRIRLVHNFMCALMILVLPVYDSAAQPPKALPGNPGKDVWQITRSTNPIPHLEQVNGRQILYVESSPFTALAAEIPWWELIYGRYKET
jgi:hypothetical protein